MSEENVERGYMAIDAFNRRDLDAFLAVCDEEVESVSRIAAIEGGVGQATSVLCRLVGPVGDQLPVCLGHRGAEPIAIPIEAGFAERRLPESNRCKRLCRPLRSHSAKAPECREPSGGYQRPQARNP